MGYARRFYRKKLHRTGMSYFTVRVKETDLWIGIDEGSFYADLPAEVETFVWRQRFLLEEYIKTDPVFKETFTCHILPPGAPLVAVQMVRAANQAGVGPMAAVAGTFAEMVGGKILKSAREVVVENGGDIFIKIDRPHRVGIFAGESPFSQRIALKIDPRRTPAGICTSSRTVGPSASMGKSDAVTVIADSAPLADAAATATGNLINDENDFEKAVEFVRKIKGVRGILVILGDRLAAWGDVQLISL